MGDVIDIHGPEESEELPLPYPECGNRTWFLWPDGDISCAACGAVIDDA